MTVLATDWLYRLAALLSFDLSVGAIDITEEDLAADLGYGRDSQSGRT